MKQFILIIMPVLLVILIGSANSEGTVQNKIQVAILLDTSNSMDGLINQARSRIWSIINEFSTAKRNGRHAGFEVALYEYGNDRLESGEGYIRMVSSMSSDLDMISEQLFSLQTHGGSEFCGKAIYSAVRELPWSTNPNDLKVIIIAGNEPFNQGNHNYVLSCQKAAGRGIIVNTIFCGDYENGIRTLWKHGADLTKGQYSNINQYRRIRQVKTPYDERILSLGRELNRTYITYGKEGKDRKRLQLRQDKNAEAAGAETAVERSCSKASRFYSNTRWDLVDAYNNGAVDIDEMDEDDFSGVLKNLNSNERKAYIKKMCAKRRALQKRIRELRTERERYIRENNKRSAEMDTLDSRIIKSLREQAEKQNFSF